MNSELSNPIVTYNFEVVAERALDAVIVDKPSEVRVRFGKPFADPRGDWTCPFQIIGIGNNTVRLVGGIDAVQAFQLAMYMAGTLLQTCSAELKLTFLDDDHLGFPDNVHRATGECPYCQSGHSSC